MVLLVVVLGCWLLAMDCCCWVRLIVLVFAFLWCGLERLLRWVSVAWLYGNSCLVWWLLLVLGLICDLVWCFVMLRIVGSRFRYWFG